MSAIHNNVVQILVPHAPPQPSLELHVGDAPRLEITAPRGEVSKSSQQSRAAQMQIISSLKPKALKDRELNVSNMLSKDGLTAALGKASGYANVKEAMMRGTYRMVNRSSPGIEFGSRHKTSLRLAEQYQNQVKSGADEGTKLQTLRTLRNTLNDMYFQKVGDAYMMGKTAENVAPNLKSMVEYIDHEIDQMPCNQYAKAHTLVTVGYPKLRDSGAPIDQKIELLEAASDHLKSAIDGGFANPSAKELLKLVQKDLGDLRSHAPLKQELQTFVQDKDKNLKHVHTRVEDPVKNMKAKLQHQEHQQSVRQDTTRDLRQWRVGLDIREFDMSSLKHVETEERTGLEHAQRDYAHRSPSDEEDTISLSVHPQSKPEITPDLDLDDPTDITLK